MQDRLEKLLNEKLKKTEVEINKLPFPIEDCLEQRKFSYNLGQHDLIMELFSTLKLKNLKYK